ncbi:DNA-binding transcriptional regulator, GntR family [Brevibacterium aurantiacum]|uniref:DNA-binding transcriptional regulator, GntR family n=2 Tax=Brevibacterium aurantiacum TaxID=273384 RepID=A0A2H1KHL2_BREAU|nr:GntR family transcriptional regulator [Brevibacterium aurantiacum]SMX99260.1 DNA-binding transcriptional regulator, GntR family [Brevibacterium aurantiacum]SMY02543.1 DNA-binding transcriptional regulator, GntR family [Brevibacterium aurantiacum]
MTGPNVHSDGNDERWQMDQEPASTKRDLVVLGLRRKILGRELERGERLRQDQVAEWFSASITPVREALRILESEGLVSSEAHRGVRVAGVDVDRLKSLFITRKLTETFAIARATTRISRHELRQADRLLDALDTASEEGDAMARNTRNEEFHFFFYDRCGLPALRDDIATRWRAFPWDLTLDSSDRLNEVHSEHQAIVDAVRQIDPDAAADHLGEHITNGFLRLAESTTGEAIADPFDFDAD